MASISADTILGALDTELTADKLLLREYAIGNRRHQFRSADEIIKFAQWLESNKAAANGQTDNEALVRFVR